VSTGNDSMYISIDSQLRLHHPRPANHRELVVAGRPTLRHTRAQGRTPRPNTVPLRTGWCICLRSDRTGEPDPQHVPDAPVPSPRPTAPISPPAHRRLVLQL